MYLEQVEVCSSPITFIGHIRSTSKHRLFYPSVCHSEELQLLIASQLSIRFKHSDVWESADLETKKGRKSGIIYSYTCSRIMCHYDSITSAALNLNNVWSHVSTTYKCSKGIALIFVCRLFSANKNVLYRLSPLIGEEFTQLFNGRKMSS